jgi:hypothetical protein
MREKKKTLFYNLTTATANISYFLATAEVIKKTLVNEIN